jgi:hypothetical protein
MSAFLEALKQENTITENGMVTNSTSLKETVDLFFRMGAMRKATTPDIIRQFSLAFNESPLEAMKVLFWGRNVRGGAGERKFFRLCLEYLARTHKEVLIKNLHLIPRFGRWDDVLFLFNTSCEDQALFLIKTGLDENNSLCAKWMPRQGEVANKIRKYLRLTPKDYRKMLVKMTDVVEQSMCSKNWGEINYSHVPSLAAARYQKAFIKNDSERYSQYISDLANPNRDEKEVKINASAVYPYDVLKSLKRGVEQVANEQWKALPNYMEGSKDRILPVVDVSGSMTAPASGSNVTCLDVSISLGLYISERSEGPFKDHFITFSSSPKLQKLSGSLLERYNQLESSEWEMSTDLQAVFKLILNQAIKHSVSEDQMPTTILILSDMEFDEAIIGADSVSAFEAIERMYEESGYKIPGLIFWNIQSRGNNVPVRFDESGTALISGFSPSILESILGAKEISPISIMLRTIGQEIYSQISI